MRHIRYTRYLCLWAIFMLSGCVSVDRRALSEKVDVERTSNLNGIYDNKPAYSSEKPFFNTDKKSTLAEILYYSNAKDAEKVEIDLVNKKILHVKFILDGKVLASRDYDLGTDFKFDSDGRIVIGNDEQCGLGPDTGIGCYGNNVALFINAEGELVSIESHNIQFLAYLIFPVSTYSKQMTIHHKESVRDGGLQ